MIIGICILINDLPRFQLMDKSLRITSNKNIQGSLDRSFGPCNRANPETRRSHDPFESEYNIF